MRVDYTYDPAGKPEKEMYGNNTFAEYAYNNALQLSALKHWKTATPTNVLLVTSDYLRDKVGNPTDMTWDSGSTTTSCVYDNISRLWKVTYPGQSQTVFGYDWVGNRNDQDWQTNVVDELTSSPYNTYTYDPHYGNLVTRNYNDVDTTFEYDNYNLLKTINWPNGNGMNQFLSDAAGNRIRMIGSDGAPTWHFIYDTTAGIPAVLAETVSNGASKLYIRTPDGRLIAQAHIVSGEPVLDHYYHFDGLGSTKALTDSDGVVSDTYTYDVWGNATHTGESQQPYMFVGQLGYYTHYQDPMLSPFSANSDKYVLLQLGVRYYAPEIGRFTQRDGLPVASESSYAYVGDEITVATDPDGLWPWGRKKPKPPPDWVKQAAKCTAKCAKDKDPTKCFVKCMGPSFTNSVCVSQFCYLWPGDPHCGWPSKKNPSGNACLNPCTKTLIRACNDCCEIKHDCCLLVAYGDSVKTLKCGREWLNCTNKCQDYQ